MHLNHLDLVVSDVPRHVDFFEQVFGFELQTNRKSPAIAVLTDHDGFVLVLQRSKLGPVSYPDGFHFGFYVADIDAVHSAHARATAAGQRVSQIVRNHRGVMFYVRCPDGVAIEVNCRADARV